jgi:hypothetical protein
MTVFYIKYKDHVLFRNADISLLNPSIREVVGWLEKETEEAVFLCFDRSFHNLPHEVPSMESGLILLKENVLEMKEIG